MPSIRDFSGGVLNQELQNRDNGGGVLFDCKNVLSSWNGELRKRTGTQWLMSLPQYQRIIPYRLPDGNDIILLLNDNTISGYEFVDENTIKPFYIFSGAAPTFPTSGWAGQVTNGDYTIWLSSAAEDTEWGQGFDTPLPTTPMKYYEKGALWTGGYDTTVNVPAYIQIYSENAQLLNSLRIRWTNTCNGNRPGHYKGWLEPVLQYSDDGTNWVSVQTQMENPYIGGANYYSASYHYGSGGSERTENYIVYKVINVAHDTAHKYWRVYCNRRIPNTQVYDGERIDLNVSDIKYLSDTKTALVIDTSSSFQITEENVDNIKYDQSNNLMILANGTDNIYSLEYSAGTMTAQTFNTTFDDNQGVPSCVCFYQNRLWLGGFSAFPTRVWGSAFGDFDDFTIPTPVSATSPISADSVEIKSRIENLWGGNSALYCLSEDGISMIDAQGGIVATNQIEFKLRNREPVDNMTPTCKDDIMVYLGRDKKKILITDFDFVVQRFKALNISESYTDFLESGIRELHYIPDRNSLIYGLLENGNWFALLFDVSKGKDAVYPFNTQGHIFDIQPVKYGEKTRLVMTTQRDGVFMLEEKLFSVEQKIMDFMTEEEKKNYTREIIGSNNAYLDCLIKKVFEQPTSVITNIPYSSSSNIIVIADGMYLGEKSLSPSISGGLYAWENTGNVLYTNSSTPSVSDPILNADQSEKTGYALVAVGDDNISVAYDKIIKTKYYCFGNTSSVTTDNYGVLNRNPAIDGIYTLGRINPTEYYGFGWGSFWGNNPAYASIGGRLYNGLQVAATIQSCSNQKLFVLSENPQIGDTVYDDTYTSIGTVSAIGTTNTSKVSSPVQIKYIEVSGEKYYRFQSEDQETEETETVTEQFYRNSAKDITAQGVSLELDEPATEVIMGFPYDSYAVLKFITPYTERKFPKEIAVNFINTGYLEVGNTFDLLKSVLNNLVESVNIDNKGILMNGNYAKTLDKHSFETPYVIVRSDKGMPFIITGMDYRVDLSNYQGGV